MSAAPLCGLVLAGGDSRRMGTDKAALLTDGVSQLERTVLLLERLIDNVHVSVRATDELRALFNCIPDNDHALGAAVRGPAAGILSAHLAHPECAWLVVACDMPLVGAELLQELLAARDPAAPATCWADESGTPEPLCAVYEPATLAPFLQSVRAGGKPSPRDWLATCGAVVNAAPDAQALRSANTPREWQELTHRHD